MTRRTPAQVIGDTLDEIAKAGLQVSGGKILITRALYIDLMSQHGVKQDPGFGMQSLIWRAPLGDVGVHVMPPGMDTNGPDAIIFKNATGTHLFNASPDHKKSIEDLKEAIEELSKVLGV